MKIGFSSNKMALVLGIAGVLGGSALLTGCGTSNEVDINYLDKMLKPKPLTCATVNTTKVLQMDPEYQNLAQEYFNARIKLAGELQQDVAKTGGEIKDQATFDKYAKAENDLNTTWLGITRKFTQKKMDAVSKACEKLTAQKGFDIVLLDSDEIPTVEFGAIDITADVQVELSSFAGTSEQSSAQPDAAASAKPAEQGSATPAAPEAEK